MIDFAISYFEGPDPVRVAVHFLQAGSVEVTATAVAQITDAEWDLKRASISAQGHGTWRSVYAGTALGKYLSLITPETMMAFAALHVLAPDAATARAFAHNPAKIGPQYPSGRVADRMGNTIGLLHHPLNPSEEVAAVQLLELGALQRFDVHAYAGSATPVNEVIFFAPFHRPSLATNLLSPEALSLLGRVP